MDFLIQNGVNWIVAIQSLGSWLEAPMKFFTFLGTEEFFILVLPALFWSIDTALGLRLGFVLLTSNTLNGLLKMVFAGPRPYWVSTDVKPFSAETSFGIPSGHAQNAAGLWSVIALHLRKPWAWVAALTLVFLIGFSRLYLGVHFLHDVAFGWLFGFIILWVIVGFWDSVVRWIKGKSLTQQTLVAFSLSMFLIVLGALIFMSRAGFVLPQDWLDNALRAGEKPDPVSMSGIIADAGVLFGFAFGLAWIAARGGYLASGPLAKRAIRYVVGLAGLLVLYIGSKAIFPSDNSILALIFRYLRYALTGFWISGGAPWLFFHFKLADKSNI